MRQIRDGRLSTIDLRDSGLPDLRGLAFNPADGHLYVRSMPPEQGAAQAGLRIDDEIVALDGKDVKAMSDDDVRRAVRGDVGSNLVVTIVRDGQRQDVTVKRSKLLKDKK